MKEEGLFMKKLTIRLLSILLVLTMLMQVSVFATDTTQPILPDPMATEGEGGAEEPGTPGEGEEPGTPGEGEEPGTPGEGEDPGTPGEGEDPGEEELGVEIPNGWFRPALYFMVKNGYMKGSSSGLMHTNTATRAEMITMITRIVGLMDQPGLENVAGADLSQYTDVRSYDWYRPYMATAVRYGMMNGTSATTLSPTAGITREQAFTIIGRIFGYGDGSTADYAHFDDAGKVSSFAAPYVGALVKAGLLSGSNNKLNPQGALSRAELAQVLYNLFGANGVIYTGTEELPEAGTILWNCAENMQDITLDGNLVLGGNAGDTIDLTNVTVTGTLTIAMRDDTVVNLSGCQINKIVLLSRTTVNNDAAINSLQISGAADAAYNGDAAKALISSTASLSGKYADVTVTADNASAAAGSEMENLLLNRNGGTFTLDGTAKNAEIKNRDYTLTGSGTVENLTIHYLENVRNCTVINEIQQLDKGLDGTTITLSNSGNVNVFATSAKFTASFAGVNDGYGSVDGVRTCQLKWYVNDVLQQTSTVRISEGSQSTLTYNFANFKHSSATVKAVLSYEGQEIAATKTVSVDNGFYTASGPVISTFGGYQLSSTARAKINAGINTVTSRGYTVGFVLVDMTTGEGIAYNADRSIYMASAIKGPYVVSVMNAYPSAVNTHYATIQNITRVSSNEAYNALRNHFGNECMVQWCKKAGIDPSIGYRRWTDMTPREVCLLWMQNYRYFTSSSTGKMVGTWFQNPSNSPIKAAIGGKYVTQTKGGWIAGSNAYYQAANDAGIVYANGRPYVVVILSTASAQHHLLRNLAAALNYAHEEMMR